MKIVRIIEKKNLWFSISVLFIVIGFALMIIRAIQGKEVLNYGIDFSGGQTMILKFDELDKRILNAPDKQAVNIKFIEEIRQVLRSFTLENSVIIITNDQQVFIKMQTSDQNHTQKVNQKFQETFGKFEILEIDFIGPSIGEELRQKAVLIFVVAMLAMTSYISWRFQWTYGLAAMLALLHDALITISFASISNIEINATFIAAILTILGYSINDTIVIFDRIRDNLKKASSENALEYISILNQSITETFRRTINTSVTVLLVLLSLIVFGGQTLKEFCLVLFVGILAGTYSSIFTASPFLEVLNRFKKSNISSNPTKIIP